MRRIPVFLLPLLLWGCAGIPKGVEPVKDFEIKRYLGTWYEIARYDHFFERGLEQVTAHYSMRRDGGVRVVNRGYDPEKGVWKEAVGKAFFVSKPDIGRMKVSFFGPFYGGYNIIDLDSEDYSFALVCGPTVPIFGFCPVHPGWSSPPCRASRIPRGGPVLTPTS